MLRILKMEHDFNVNESAEQLFKSDRDVLFTVEAPIYWWLTCDFEKRYFDMPKDEFKFCFDAWDQYSDTFIQQLQLKVFDTRLDFRKLMQILPLSTLVVAKVYLSYQDICEVCENYLHGEYDFKEIYNQWPMSREWTDFCETLMDIRGVRELIEES